MGAQFIESLESRQYLNGLALLGTAADYGDGDQPRAIAVGDVNGDGKKDLVVADVSDDAVAVLTNNGDGSFAFKGEYSTGVQPQAVTLADLNGDGRLDIVTANQDQSISVLLGNGNGTFQPQQTYAVGPNAQSVVAANLNGKVDLVVANAGQGTLGILLNNGDGTFQPEQTIGVGTYPAAVTAIDLNGDGKLDLVVANRTSGTVGVLLGNGNGTFAPQVTFAAGPGCDALAVGDVTGDGKLDVVTANSQNGSVSVLPGNGNGTFGTPLTFAVGNGPSAIALADLNGDAHLDIISANAASADISVLLGNGNGTFAQQQTFAVGSDAQSDPRGLAVADVNGDGLVDVVATNYGDNSVSVLENSGPSISLNSTTGVLYCTGSPGPDTISITDSYGEISCLINDTLGIGLDDSQVSAVDIATGEGGDTISIGDSVPQTTVTSGKGPDTIVASNDDDMLSAGKGRDQITAMGGQTIVMGGRGADSLSAGGQGGVSLYGGSGDDIMINGAGSGDVVDGGTGVNFAQLNSGDTLSNIFEIYDPNPNAVTTGGVTPDFTTQSTAGVLQIFGTPDANNISVSLDGDGNLLVNGRDPVPEANYTGILLAGRAGDDTLGVSSQVDIPTTIRGAAGNDSLTGGGVDNVLVGGAGSDTLQGDGAGTNLLVPGHRAMFDSGPTGNDLLIGGPPGSLNIADFSHRTDNLFLSNDGKDDSGDAALGETTTIMPSVQDIFAGTGRDTVVSTTAGGFLSAGFGQDSIVSGGSNTVIVAGPVGAGGDTVVSAGSFNALYLMNSHADTYGGNVTTDILEIDVGLDTPAA